MNNKNENYVYGVVYRKDYEIIPIDKNELEQGWSNNCAFIQRRNESCIYTWHNKQIFNSKTAAQLWIEKKDYILKKYDYFEIDPIVPSSENKREKQDPLESLAEELDAFVYEEDFYDYHDQVDDRDAHISLLKEDLSAGKEGPILDYLEDYIENGGSELSKAKSLINKIHTFLSKEEHEKRGIDNRI